MSFEVLINIATVTTWSNCCRIIVDLSLNRKALLCNNDKSQFSITVNLVQLRNSAQ